ncbi:MAG: putative porin, partial [Bacteroidota bacterium]
SQIGSLKNVGLILLCVVLGTMRGASQQDTLGLRSADAFQFREGQWHSDPEYLPVDTSLSTFHYHNYLLYDGYTSLGNLGLPTGSMRFQTMPGIGLNSRSDHLREYQYRFDDVDYYRVQRPYTRVKYVLGSQSEQLIKARHTQNISQRVNAGFDFRRINSKGTYDRQRATHSNFMAHMSYFSPNERYRLLANYNLNIADNQDNGGLSGDSLFDAGLISQRGSIPVNLTNAFGIVRNNELYVKQVYALGDTYTVLDTLDSAQVQHFVPQSRLVWGSRFNDQTYFYKDQSPDSAFYSPLFTDTSAILIQDKIEVQELENRFAWESDSLGQHLPQLEQVRVAAGLTHQFVNINQRTISEQRHNIKLDGHLAQTGAARHLLDLEAGYVAAGFNRGEMLLKLRNKLMVGRADSMTNRRANWFFYGITFQRNRPAFFQERFSNRYFEWDLDFDKQQVLSGQIGFRSVPRQFEISARVYGIDNFTYYGTQVRPEQANGTVTVFQATAKKHFKAGKFHLDLAVHYQYTDRDDILRLPELYTYNSAYFEGPLFRNAVTARLGFDVFYNTSYKADTYMPVIRQFHLQNDQEVGDYVYVDFFTAVKIRKARVFFKVAHLNSELVDPSFSVVPSYFLVGRTLRLGIDWTFLN